MRQLITIGIAGGIGSGKSTFAVALAQAVNGFVSNSDAMVRELFARERVRQGLVTRFGAKVLDPQGQVDRAYLAAHVFADAGQRKGLEEYLYPMLAEDRVTQRAEAVAAGHEVFLLDAPLLFEAGLDRECDAVIFVDVDRAERLRRVIATRGWDDAELARREGAQWPVERKKAASQLVVRNDGPMHGAGSLTQEAARAAAWIRSQFPSKART